ncbi:unnamed protein product [Musa hybrid cultivar]
MGRYTCSTRCSSCAFVIGRTWITSSLASNISALNTSYKRSNFPHRVASQLRFREKRKERNFDKKIWYAVWKEVALRMQRNRGQFRSSKSKPQDATLGVTNCEGMQHWGSIEVVIIVASVQIKHQ